MRAHVRLTESHIRETTNNNLINKQTEQIYMIFPNLPLNMLSNRLKDLTCHKQLFVYYLSGMNRMMFYNTLC